VTIDFQPRGSIALVPKTKKTLRESRISVYTVTAIDRTWNPGSLLENLSVTVDPGGNNRTKIVYPSKRRAILGGMGENPQEPLTRAVHEMCCTPVPLLEEEVTGSYPGN
jgi:hypothetical protein